MLKRFLLVIIFIVSFISVFAQSDSIYVRNKWCARKDTALLFIDGNNMIQVYSAAFKPGDITVKSLDKSLRVGNPEIKGDTLSVLAMPFPEKGKQMRLAIMNKKKSKLLKVIYFSCDSIPRLLAKVGNIQAPEAKRKDILSQVAMKAYFPKSLYSYPYTIKAYTFRISTPKGGATIPVKGFFMINSVLKEISEAPDGTVMEFTDIKATCPECSTRDVQNIKLKIK